MSVMMHWLHPSAVLGANSLTTPAAVMRAILAGAPVNSVPSVNQRLPSEPFVIARGLLLAVGTLNCFSVATGAARAALPSDSARPPASTVAIARPNRLDMVPPSIDCRPYEAGLRRYGGAERTVSVRAGADEPPQCEEARGTCRGRKCMSTPQKQQILASTPARISRVTEKEGLA